MNALDAVLRFRKENSYSEETIKRLNSLLLKAMKREKIKDVDYPTVKDFFAMVLSKNDEESAKVKIKI